MTSPHTDRQTRTVSLPVIVAARHVRLSRAHVDVLFGPGAELVELAPLPSTALVLALEVLEVRGPGGTLPGVRVLGPVASRTEVRVGLRDLAALGIEPALATLDADRSPGCTLVGPHGTVVLTTGVLTGLRRLSLTHDLLASTGIPAGGRTHVQLRGDRMRDLRDVPVELGDSAWLSVDVDDANALELGPTARATLSS